MDEEMWLKIFIRYDIMLKLGYVMNRDEVFNFLEKKLKKLTLEKLKSSVQ